MWSQTVSIFTLQLDTLGNEKLVRAWKREYSVGEWSHHVLAQYIEKCLAVADEPTWSL